VKRFAIVLAAVLLVLVAAAPEAANAQATFVLVNLDAGTGQGLDDPTVVAPVGGNPGTTLGQQRLNVFQRAFDLWGYQLNSAVPIRVQASFAALACTPTQAVLGSAGAITVNRDFPGAPFAATWFSAALANSIAGVDLDGGTNDEISAQFNVNIDNNPACLNGLNWYYGLDANPPGPDIEFLTVILHELGHGLGFQSFVNAATGQVLAGFDDVWSWFLGDATLLKLWINMTAAEKMFSATNTGNLVWAGPNVTAMAGTLTAGVHPLGFVQMNAPNPLQPGSSVSHFDPAVTPNELMEPSFTNLTTDVGLTFELFQDISWNMTPLGYSIFSPIPGSAGNTNLFSTTGGVPGAMTFLLYGIAGGATPIPGCPGVSSAIASPAILTSGPTDASGNFNFSFNVRAGAAGATVLLEAVELPSCLVSNVVTQTF